MTDPNTPPTCPDWCDGEARDRADEYPEPHWQIDNQPCNDLARDGCPDWESAGRPNECPAHPSTAWTAYHSRDFGPDLSVGATEHVPFNGDAPTWTGLEIDSYLVGSVFEGMSGSTLDDLERDIARAEAIREHIPAARALVARITAQHFTN